MNPRIEDLVPRCYRTVTNQINAKFLERKASIVRSITNAKGKVTISFDGWKANNDVLDLLSVVVHYLRDDYKVYNVVLAMRDCEDVVGRGSEQYLLGRLLTIA